MGEHLTSEGARRPGGGGLSSNVKAEHRRQACATGLRWILVLESQAHGWLLDVCAWRGIFSGARGPCIAATLRIPSVPQFQSLWLRPPRAQHGRPVRPASGVGGGTSVRGGLAHVPSRPAICGVPSLGVGSARGARGAPPLGGRRREGRPTDAGWAGAPRARGARAGRRHMRGVCSEEARGSWEARACLRSRRASGARVGSVDRRSCQ